MFCVTILADHQTHFDEVSLANRCRESLAPTIMLQFLTNHIFLLTWIPGIALLPPQLSSSKFFRCNVESKTEKQIEVREMRDPFLDLKIPSYVTQSEVLSLSDTRLPSNMKRTNQGAVLRMGDETWCPWSLATLHSTDPNRCPQLMILLSFSPAEESPCETNPV